MEKITPKIVEPEIDFIEEKRLVGTMLSGRPNSSSAFISALVALTVVFSTLLYWVLPQFVSSLLPASGLAVFQHGQWWRLFSAVFIHSDPAHLLSNLLWLGIFGYFVFGYFGLRIFPWIAFLLAALVNGLTIATYSQETTLLGASGLVYILGAFWLTLYFLIQRQYRITNRFIRVLGISLLLFAPTTFIPTTSYTAHGFGFLFGIFSGIIYFYRNKDRIRNYEIYEKTLVPNLKTSN